MWLATSSHESMIKQNGCQHSDWRLLNIPFFHHQNPVQFVLYALIKILKGHPPFLLDLFD